MSTVLENNKWKIKIYFPPREHGNPHVHVISKEDRAELKLYLETLEVSGRTRFSKVAVKKIVRYVHKHYDFLLKKWEEHHGKKTQS